MHCPLAPCHTLALTLLPRRPQSPFVFYEFDEEKGEPALTGLTIEIARLLETELNCKFEFILGSPEAPEVRNPPARRACAHCVPEAPYRTRARARNGVSVRAKVPH